MPGAVLLALDYAERHGMPLIDVLQEVSFPQGKVVVGARMQRRLASRAGYLTRLVDSSPEHATVVVVGPDGKQVGRPVTYTMDTARALEICFKKVKGQIERDDAGQPVLKEPWRDSENMLFHRATTRATRPLRPV